MWRKIAGLEATVEMLRWSLNHTPSCGCGLEVLTFVVAVWLAVSFQTATRWPAEYVIKNFCCCLKKHCPASWSLSPTATENRDPSKNTVVESVEKVNFFTAECSHFFNTNFWIFLQNICDQKVTTLQWKKTFSYDFFQRSWNFHLWLW